MCTTAGKEGERGWFVATMARLLCPGSVAPTVLPPPSGFSHETLMQLPAGLEETRYSLCIRNSFTRFYCVSENYSFKFLNFFIAVLIVGLTIFGVDIARG